MAEKTILNKLKKYKETVPDKQCGLRENHSAILQILRVAADRAKRQPCNKYLAAVCVCVLKGHLTE